MSRPYDHQAIQAKWQAYWEQDRTFRASEDPARPKFYCLDMFPYPSGSGLHVGHLEGYTATDIVSRFKRMQGFNVLHPMGWDAFGLPAEQYAVKTGVHPAITTAENIATFKRQMKRVGLSYDWERELSTTDPGYYRWTQWIFLKLFERGLAYVAEAPGGAENHRVRGTASRRSCAGGLAGQHARNAKKLDRPLDRRRGGVRAGRRPRQPPHLYHASRHALRRDLHGIGAR